MKNMITNKESLLFEGIENEDLNDLLFCLHHFTRNYERGAYIYLDQEDIHNIGIVIKGSVHMLKEDLWGNETLLAYMGKGDIFGETFALRKETKSYVSFVAVEDTDVLFLSLDHLLHPCPKHCIFHTQLSQNMYDLMGKKNIQLMERIEVASKKSLREKILAYLSLQAQKQESKYITVPFNRTEMASYLQTNRSAMTRELTNMKKEGLIDFSGNTFRLMM